MAGIDDLQAVEAWAGGLLAKLSPSVRRRVMLVVARELRRSQQQRIAAQRNPDGSAYEPRKAKAAKASRNLRGKAGRIKRHAMFSKLRTARFLRTEASEGGIAIGFTGRVSRIATIHQHGGVDRVSPGGPEVRYPARVLLGFTDADLDLIRDALLKHLAA